MTISEDLTCVLEASISGTITSWGVYTLRIEGTPIIRYERISGTVTLTRYRAGIDTVQVSGSWTGEFNLEADTASGAWSTFSESSFTASGEWGAVRR